MKVEKSRKLPTAYFLFNLYTYLVFALFTGPLWVSMIEIWLLLGTLAVATIFWVVTMNKDPGFIKPNPNVEFLVSLSRNL